ncbi:extracellular superoxide dismutase [Cu-Zn]-like [Heptranchias perlo]|uniref:extracellular superoxide dismutase [Cu-Zn]-like n=1 Tax=Heptranchias perlo TaxID=212740 RepID=UPI00355AB59B
MGMQRSALNLLLLVGAVVLKLPGVGGNLDEEAKQMKELNPPIEQSAEVFAVCQLVPSSDLAADLPAISGYVLFKETCPISKLEAFFYLVGFPLDFNQPSRAIHVHRFGDLSGGCLSTGPHFNPLNVNHPQHPGDFNNFQVKSGRIVQYVRDLKATLYGTHSILGRGVVVHEKEDDLGLGGNEGSILHGNAGRRLACCTIAISNGNLWKKMVHDM